MTKEELCNNSGIESYENAYYDMQHNFILSQKENAILKHTIELMYEEILDLKESLARYKG